MAKKHYGIPYMGSKEKILDLIQYIFDRESNKKYLIDPFCGGFSVSAYALENTKFKVLANDLNEYVIDLYKEMLFNNSKEIKKVWLEWVTRERFKDVKENPEKYPKWYVGYVLTIWSFGNRQSAYLFGKDIEEIKRQAHEYLMENGYKENPELRIKLVKDFKQQALLEGRFELQQLQQLERLERLDSLDWHDFIQSIPEEILSQSFIYCDPPYENTAQYQKNSIDYKKFWDWFREFPYPVYVSSYLAPEDIKPIKSKERTSLLSSASRKKVVENIYFNGKGVQVPTMHDMLFNTNQPTPI